MEGNSNLIEGVVDSKTNGTSYSAVHNSSPDLRVICIHNLLTTATLCLCLSPDRFLLLRDDDLDLVGSASEVTGPYSLT